MAKTFDQVMAESDAVLERHRTWMAESEAREQRAQERADQERESERKKPWLSDTSIAHHVGQVEAALRTRDSGMARLTRGDGQPLYGPAEHAERVAALQVPVDELVTAKRELAFKEAQEAEAEIAAIDARQSNPISRLNDDEVARAASLRGFVEADLDRFSATDIEPQVSAALAAKDRAAAAAWWHALLGRVHKLDLVAEGSRQPRGSDEMAERTKLVAMVDQLAAALRDPTLEVKRQQQLKRIDQARLLRQKINDLVQPEKVDALVAELEASGRYSRFG